MNERPTHPDEVSEERRFAVSISDALAAPPLSDRFGAQLGERLKQEFAQRHPGKEDQSGTMATLLRTRRKLSTDDPDDASHRRAVARARREVRRLSGDPAPRMGRGRKYALVASLAAVLVTCVWAAPGYTWTRMVEALREQPWVEVTVLGDQDQTAVWLSTRQGTPLMSRGGLARLGESRLQAGESRAAGELLERRRATREVEGQLFALLAGQTEVSESDLRQRVRATRARPTAVKDGVELDVTLECSGRKVRARFLVDAKTRLPLACEVLEPLLHQPAADSALRFTFAYPSQDPAGLARLESPTKFLGHLLAATTGRCRPAP